jgi:UDP-N-acetyl-D-glucosamine dehydrogenase
LVNQGFFRATTSYSAISDCQIVILCVPTPLDHKKEPDLSHVIEATKQIAKYAHSGILVVLESTSYPGTTKEVVVPILSGSLRLGEDVFVCFSPERIDPGRKDWTAFNTPKVIGGITKSCLELGKTFYSSALQTVISVSNTETAEMVKILENSFRSVNIAFVNEMMIVCDKLGVNIWEVIDVADTKPFGFMKFSPGPGVGGHCIPIDPLYLTWKLKQLNQEAQFISLANEINEKMPIYWISKLEESLFKHSKKLEGSRILILGVAYKKDVCDVRESPALDIIKILLSKGSKVDYYDPFVPQINVAGQVLQSCEKFQNISDFDNVDGVMVVTDHSCFDALCPYSSSIVINCRGKEPINNPNQSSSAENLCAIHRILESGETLVNGKNCKKQIVEMEENIIASIR